MDDFKPMSGTFYDVNAVAEYLGVTHGTVRLMIKRGEIGHHVFPINSIRISSVQLADFIRETKRKKEQKDD